MIFVNNFWTLVLFSFVAFGCLSKISTILDDNRLYVFFGSGKSPWDELASISKLHILYGTNVSLSGCAFTYLCEHTYSYLQVVSFLSKWKHLFVCMKTQPEGLIFWIWKYRNSGGMALSYKISFTLSKINGFDLRWLVSLSYSYQRFFTLLKVEILLNVTKQNLDFFKGRPPPKTL